jgi:ribonuclease VapC
MIVVDTSAIIAIVTFEPMAQACAKVIADADQVFISAGTMAELLIVAGRRGVGHRVDDFLASLQLEVRPVLAADAQRMSAAYTRWGKGMHPAGLNMGDCFAYALAAQLGCPLLFVGNDFARTDIVSALA